MGAVWPSSLCHCRHKGACPLAAGSPNGCVVKAENKHRASETGQNQAVSESSSRGAKPSTSLQQPQPGTVAGLGKVAEGREEQSCSCCSLQLSNKLHILETSVRMTGTEKKKKLAGMGNFPRERATVITLAVRILSLAGSHQLCFIFYVLTYKEPWPAFPRFVLGPPDTLEIAYHIE